MKMRFFICLLLLAVPAIAAKHGIKTPDGLGLHRVVEGTPDPSLPAEQFWSVNETIPEGYTRNGWQLVEGVVQPVLVQIPAPSIPESVSPRQLTEWLIRAGLIDTVEAIIGGIPDPIERRIAQNWWAKSTEFRRDHPLVSAIAQQIGKTAEEVDQIFSEASQL